MCLHFLASLNSQFDRSESYLGRKKFAEELLDQIGLVRQLVGGLSPQCAAASLGMNGLLNCIRRLVSKQKARYIFSFCPSIAVI